MNKTCPKCAADYNGRPAPNQHDYWCGSTTWNDGDFYQSPECVRRERDQLLERNRELVGALSEMIEILKEWHCDFRHEVQVREVDAVKKAETVLAKAKEIKP